MADLRMPDLNKVIIAGRITRDPELKHSANGTAYCRIGIANTRYYKTKDGEKREETCFADVVQFGPSAEWIADKLAKGRPVLVEGALSTSEYEDRESGKKRTSTSIRSQRITPLDWDDDKPATNTAPRPQSDGPTYDEDDIPF